MVPRHVEREDFFEDMQEMLRLRPEVTELTAVPDAFTPVIKMNFSDIPVCELRYSLVYCLCLYMGDLCAHALYMSP